MSGKRILSVMTVVLGLASCSGKSDASSSSATDAPATPNVVASGVMGPKGDTFDVVAGRSVHVEEGMDDEGAADALLSARQNADRDGIERAYALPSYHHYGNDNEMPRPSCKVADQDPISVDQNKDLGQGSPDRAIHCTLSDGSDMFATGVRP